eukprot:1160514-Pelagomonas_calceolata.AAC.8
MRHQEHSLHQLRRGRHIGLNNHEPSSPELTEDHDSKVSHHLCMLIVHHSMQDSQHKFKHGWEMGKEDKPLTRCALRDSCGNRVKTTGMQPCLSKYIFVLKEFPSSAQLWEFVPLQTFAFLKHSL